ncbi:MAG: hypothetical protein E6H60_03315 [Betaproteobacteria bacterium]|nr:MAG: hypothetical protein E6H60_03315 [Betaproteobacteria bacterium]
MSIPALKRGASGGQDARDVGVDHAAREHRADRQHKAGREENEERQHQCRGAQLLAAAALPERAAQLGGVVFDACQRCMERRRRTA